MNKPRRSSVLRAKSPSLGGNSATGHSDSGGGVSATKISLKKYKFHPDYAQAVLGDDQKRLSSKNGASSAKPRNHVKLHPFEDNDEFWQKKYKIVNYRKKYPKDYDENLFTTLYDWITNGEKKDLNDGRGENILFKDTAPKIGAKIKPPRINKVSKDSLDQTKKMHTIENSKVEDETGKSPKLRRARSSEGLRPSQFEPNFRSEKNYQSTTDKIQRRRSSSFNKKLGKKM